MADGMLATQRTTKRHRRRKKRDAPVEAAGPDHGPAVRLANGTVEIVQGADPDAPARTVRRAVRVSHYVTAWRRGELSKPEFIAAERYGELCEFAAGGRDSRGLDGAPGGSPAWSRTPPHTAVQAESTLRAAHAKVGHDGTALLRAYVRDNLSVEAIAFNRARGEGGDAEAVQRRYREGQKVIGGRIRAALTLLAEHWKVGRK